MRQQQQQQQQQGQEQEQEPADVFFTLNDDLHRRWANFASREINPHGGCWIAELPVWLGNVVNLTMNLRFF